VQVEGGTATQSTTAYSGDAGRARDGNTDGGYGNGSVTHTEESLHQPYWDLDLGTTAGISKVQLWNRTDCCSDRLADVHVFVSDKPFTSTDPAVLAGTAGVQHRLVSGQLGVSTDVTFNGSAARYVRVQLDGANALSLAEVKILAG